MNGTTSILPCGVAVLRLVRRRNSPRLTKSTQFDWRLADDDIAGSRAHARALGRAGLLTADELQRMEDDALDELQRHVDSGSFAPIEDDEDEATALERGLIEIAGDELGGKAARRPFPQRPDRLRSFACGCAASRIDRQTAARSRLNALVEQSEKAGRTVMPGRTICSTPSPFCLPTSSWPTLGR